MPVVSAAWEAEVGGSLGLERLRLQRAVIVPLLSNLGDRARPCLKIITEKVKKRKVSCLILEAKQGWAWLMLGWQTAWEYRVL